MNNDELHEKFGVTGERMDAWADEYEGADWSHMRFGDDTDLPVSSEHEERILKQVEDFRAGRLETFSLDEVEEHLGLAD